MYRSAVVI